MTSSDSANAKIHGNLLLLCTTYTIAAANEYWLLDWLSSLYDVRLAIFAALLQNASWPVQIFYYRREKEAFNSHPDNLGKPRIITPEMYKSYFILGFLSGFITLSRTMGITSLPPTIYVICANTEIVFETIMTYALLKRAVSIYQLASVALVLSGVMASLYNPITERYGENQNVSQEVLLVGVAVSLFSRFASSLNTVLADRFLGKDAKSRMGVLECSLANSLIPFCVLPLALLAVPEYRDWGPVLIDRAPNVRTCIALLCCLVTICKHTDRLSKFSIVGSAGTMIFAAVDANMKVVAGIGSFLFFGEVIYWPQVLGFVLVFFALIIMYVDKKKKLELQMLQQQMQAHLLDNPEAAENVKDTDAGIDDQMSGSPPARPHSRASGASRSRSRNRKVSKSSPAPGFLGLLGSVEVETESYQEAHERAKSVADELGMHMLPSSNGDIAPRPAAESLFGLDSGLHYDPLLGQEDESRGDISEGEEGGEVRDAYELRYSICSS